MKLDRIVGAFDAAGYTTQLTNPSLLVMGRIAKALAAPLSKPLTDNPSE